jgi:hypothetical protein
MAKKAVRQTPVTYVYKVTSSLVGKTLGPHPVVNSGNDRVVVLTDKQARYYVEQGVIELAA